MTPTAFYKKLTALTLGLFAILTGLSWIPIFEDTLLFSGISLLVFVALTAFIFHLGSKSINSSNKNEFTTVAIVAIFGKLVLTLLILFTYHYGVQPASKMYVIPFLIIYLAFTIFETGVMMRLAKPSED